MLKYTFSLFFCLTLSCNSVEKGPHADALPHTIDKRENTAPVQLSDADKELMAKAKGRTADFISGSRLTNRLEFAAGKLHVFNFWRLNCDACRHNNILLEEVQSTIGDEKLNIIHINLDSTKYKSEVNIAIRDQGLVGEIFQLKSEQGHQSLDPEMPLPAFYLIDNARDLKFFYKQKFTKEELITIFQALVI